MNVPGQWEPVSDVEAPATYADNAFYASLRWRDRDILNMLDKVSPLSELANDVGVDLCPQPLLIVSDVIVRAA